jgi:putative DNA-invertase from lambdoid prophage Rac
MMKTAIAFIRVSTDKQKTDRQKIDLENYAKANDIKIYQWLELKVSGSKAKSYIDEIYKTAKKYDFVMFQEVSRIGRSMSATADLLNRLNENKIGVIITSQSIQTIKNGKVDISANLLINILSSLAEHERQILGERIVSGIEARRIKGLPIGRPEGKMHPFKLLNKGKNKSIVDLLLAGNSIRKVANDLEVAKSQVQRIKKVAIAEGIIKK